ncbi:unnamed protein product [Soboliphyme baturini]|uniref:C2H2-type domain-containing protein n=1 Tax=Soboliphyme baturini TaxID=241478 RepID=A0A3P7Z853_9BILA|nr:unnamed protein product [Soboliphyme baturini]
MPFYNFWTCFSTAKTYYWLDKHDIRQAPNRRVLRIMQKENEKLRNLARKARNDEIRALAKFVRKRDKRVIAHRKAVELKRTEQLKKIEEHQLRQRLKNLKYVKKYFALVGLAHLSNEVSDGIKSGILHCLICRKIFKNVGSFKSHIKSKKHNSLLSSLRSTLPEEELAFLEDELQDSLQTALVMPSSVADVVVSAEETSVMDDDLAVSTTAPGSDSLDDTSASVKRSKPRHKNSERSRGSTSPTPNKTSLQCETCKEIFPSRNRLFLHINSSNHATIRNQQLPKAREKSGTKNITCSTLF